jgi:hypothetical protein
MGECILHKVLIAIALFVACPVILTQQTLTNDSVVKLVKAGFSGDLIAKTINSSAGNYDTSVGGLQHKLGSLLLLAGSRPVGQQT